jgi:hypothetical protein
MDSFVPGNYMVGSGKEKKMKCTAFIRSTGQACKNTAKKDTSFCGIHKVKPPKPVAPDTYTEEILRRRFAIHKRHVEEDIAFQAETGLKFRLHAIPEDISENIIKFAIHNYVGDTTSRWNCDKGDLVSEKEGVQECKCFTSDGPLSFTPTSEWDVIYFLDARKWLENTFTLFRVPLRRDSETWKGLKVKKDATFADQTAQGRRPRGGWESVLHPQLGVNAQKVFEGSFEDIFTKAPAEALADSQ